MTIKSIAYLAGVGAHALDYQGPHPFGPSDIGYNDYADGLRDGAGPQMLDGEIIEEIAEDRDRWQEQCGKEEDNNVTLRCAIDDAIGNLEEATKILRETLQ
jgi:hypothetical protein